MSMYVEDMLEIFPTSNEVGESQKEPSGGHHGPGVWSRWHKYAQDISGYAQYSSDI